MKCITVATKVKLSLWGNQVPKSAIEGGSEEIILFIEHLLCSRYCVISFPHNISSEPQHTPMNFKEEIKV